MQQPPPPLPQDPFSGPDAIMQGFPSFDGFDPTVFGQVETMGGLGTSDMNFGSEFGDWFDSGMLSGDLK
jgi:hypothetical protein